MILRPKNGNGRTWVQPFLEAPRGRLAKTEDDGAAPIRGRARVIYFVFFLAFFFFVAMT
jgi:hypothetical protein